jgi:hypothetical protein
MDEKHKKEMLREWREEHRAAARADFPLPARLLRAMFEMLNRELPIDGCDHSRRLTERWLEHNGHLVSAVCAWLDEHGGYCDCEVLANVEQHVDDALRCIDEADTESKGPETTR